MEEKNSTNAGDVGTAISVPVSFTVQDISVMKNVILSVSSKGFFSPDDYVVIGNLYQKLKLIEQQVQKTS